MDIPANNSELTNNNELTKGALQPLQTAINEIKIVLSRKEEDMDSSGASGSGGGREGKILNGFKLLATETVPCQVKPSDVRE